MEKKQMSKNLKMDLVIGAVVLLTLGLCILGWHCAIDMWVTLLGFIVVAGCTAVLVVQDKKLHPNNQ